MNLFGHDMLALMSSHGYLLLFLILMIEEAGVPLPIPGDLLLLFSGSLIAQGVLGLAPSLAILTVATLIGTSLLYSIALRGGRPLLRRHGRWLRLKEERINRAERWLGKRPLTGVALLRLTPGLRIYSTIVAGLLAVPRAKATVSFVVSGVMWSAAWLVLGMLLGTNVNRAASVIAQLDSLFIPAIVVVVIAALAFWLGRRWFRRCRPSLPAWRTRLSRPRPGSATVSALAVFALLLSPALLGLLRTVG